MDPVDYGYKRQKTLVKIDRGSPNCDFPRCEKKFSTLEAKLLHLKDNRQHPAKSSEIFIVDLKNLDGCELCLQEPFLTYEDKLTHYDIHHKRALSAYCPSCFSFPFVNPHSKIARHGRLVHKDNNDEFTKKMEYLNNDIIDLKNQLGTGAQRVSFKGPNIGLYVNRMQHCLICQQDLTNLTEQEMREHCSLCVRRDGLSEEVIRIEQTLQDGDHKKIRYQHKDVLENVDTSFTKVRDLIRRDITLFLEEKKVVVANYKLTILFERNIGDETEEEIIVAFRPSSKRFELGTSEEIDGYLQDVLATLREKIADFIQLGSGWILKDILSHDLRLTNVQKLRKGGRYISPPESLLSLIRGKHNRLGVIIPQTDDDRCILECLTLYFENDKNQLTKLAGKNPSPTSEFIKDNFPETITKMCEQTKTVSFPLKIQKSEIAKIKKKLNIEDKQITIIGFDEIKEELYPLYSEYDTNSGELENIKDEKEAMSIYDNRERNYITLLYYSRGGIGHFGLVIDFNQLFFSATANLNRKFLCRNCFSNSVSPLTLLKHEKKCSRINQNHQKMILPKRISTPNGETLTPTFKFDKFHQQLPQTHVGVFDLECTFSESQKTEKGTIAEMPAASCLFMTANLHEAPNQNDPVEIKEAKTRQFPASIKYGEDSPIAAIKQMLKVSATLKKDQMLINQHHLKPNLTPSEEKLFKTAKNCGLCNQPLDRKTKNKSDMPVRNHCHQTGRFLSPAHSSCNLRYKEKTPFVIFAHCGKKYDFKYLCQAIITLEEQSPQPVFKEIRPITQTGENFLCIDLVPYCEICAQSTEKHSGCSHFKTIRLLDSYSFIPERLDSIIGTLRDSIKQGKAVETVFPETTKLMRDTYLNEIPIEKALRKGCFPYSHFKSQETLKEEQLPSREAFYDQLKEEPIAESEYEFAQDVWNSLAKWKKKAVQSSPETFIPNYRLLSETQKEIEKQKASKMLFRDYHDFYLRIDCTGLLDGLINFRSVARKEHDLEILNFITLPSYSWSAMSKQLQTRVEHIDEEQEDVYLFLESMIAGGNCYAAKRHLKANNQFIEGYDACKPSIFGLYVDANNLYVK